MSGTRPDAPRGWSRQSVAFIAVGLVATAIQYGALLITVQGLHRDPVLGSSVGFVLGAVVNYLLNYHVTFRSANPHVSTAARFVVISSAGLLLNGSIMYGLVQWLHVLYWLAQIAATVAVTVWNFLCSALWTFAGTRASTDRKGL